MSFPSAPKPTTVVLTDWVPTLVSTSQNLKQQVRTRGGQRYKVTLSWDRRSRSDIAKIRAAVAALRGQYNTTTLVIPGYSDTPQGTWAGAPAMDGANQTGRTINLKGFSAGATVKADDMFNVAGDSKLYRATADGTADGSGKIAALPIEPALVNTALADGAVLTSTNAVLTCALQADESQFSTESPNLTSAQLAFVERV